MLLILTLTLRSKYRTVVFMDINLIFYSILEGKIITTDDFISETLTIPQKIFLEKNFFLETLKENKRSRRFDVICCNKASAER